MSEIYTRLFSLPVNLYADGVPVMISAGALQKNNKTGKLFVQLRLQNIAANHKTIIAVKVSVTPYDISKKELESPIVYQYLDLHADRGNEFGQKTAIFLNNPVTRCFSLSVLEVVFSDGTVWNGNNQEWTSLGTQPLLQEELGIAMAAQYCRDTFADAKYVLHEQNGVWRCACGGLNHSGEEHCCHCGNGKAQLIRALDRDTLSENLIQYGKSEQEKLALHQKNAAKSRRKLIAIALLIICLIVGIATGSSIKRQQKIDAVQQGLQEALNTTFWSAYIDSYGGYRFVFYTNDCLVHNYTSFDSSGKMIKNIYEYKVVDVEDDSAKLMVGHMELTVFYHVDSQGKYHIESIFYGGTRLKNLY